MGRWLMMYCIFQRTRGHGRQHERLLSQQSQMLTILSFQDFDLYDGSRPASCLCCDPHLAVAACVNNILYTYVKLFLQ